ncbi:MAG: hypothetical protein E7Z62_02990 [Thermoplasmata archaeon]|nr:hypothetical protein [Thermoplasmata archaeon]MBE6523902.1 hypothetical protein [Thermoplasmata archaeon]
MVTSEELNLTFQKVGNDFGFENVEAEFSPFRDLKVKWIRTCDFANFSVSDYLKEAPEDVVKGIAKTIFSRILAEEELDYPECAKEWLTSQEFRDLNQEKYIERSRNLAVSDENEDEKLWDAYHRIVDAGLVEEINGLKLFWSKEESESKAGQSSCLMRVVIMNRKLLNDNVPEEVLDYCLLHEIANISLDFGLDFVERKKEVEDLLATCPGREAAKEWLKKAMIEV